MIVLPGTYESLIAGLSERGIVSLEETEPEEINVLFAVSKNGDKQRVIVDARPPNLHFTDPSPSNMPHPGFFKWPQADVDNIYTEKLDVDNFYNRLTMPQHFRKYFWPSLSV